MSTKFESTCILKSLHRIETQLNMVMILAVTLGLLIFTRLKKALINTPGLYAPAIVSLVELMYKLHDRTEKFQDNRPEKQNDATPLPQQNLATEQVTEDDSDGDTGTDNTDSFAVLTDKSINSDDSAPDPASKNKIVESI